MLELAPSPSARPWLSVLLPVYGVERYLPACARSLLAQELDGVELLFVDDASRDSSGAILAALAAGEPGRIRLHRHAENRGPSAGRNTLLDEARGEWLWFVDPDDLVEPGAIASLRRIVQRHRPDLVMCDYRAFEDETGRPSCPRDRCVSTFRGPRGVLARDRDALVRGLFRQGKFESWSKVVRRTAWPDALRFAPGAFEDLRLASRLAMRVESWFHSGEVWIAYRQRRDSMVGAMTVPKLDLWMDALAGYQDELRAWEVAASPATHAAVADYCARSLMSAGALAERLDPEGLEDHLRRWAQRWRTATALTPGALERRYWLSGRLKRAAQWRRWRRRAQL